MGKEVHGENRTAVLTAIAPPPRCWFRGAVQELPFDLGTGVEMYRTMLRSSVFDGAWTSAPFLGQCSPAAAL